LKTVGIIGCGVIGSIIVKAVREGTLECDKLILYDYRMEKAEKLAGKVRSKAEVVRSVEEMMKLDPRVIVEAASQEAVREYAERILDANIDLIVMSVGALLDLKIKSNRLHIPSGAVGGLDAISTAGLAGISEVLLTTRKSPRALDMSNREEKVIFEGSAEDAVKRFPREINVAATLALTVPSEKVKVKIISDPNTSRNVHEIRVRWKYGDIFLKFANEPDPENPGTSALAAWSAIKLLKDLLMEYPGH
jgi:aspartate dehydrogenase